MQSNPKLWLDASDTTTITLAGLSVTEWRDKSSTQLVFRPNQLYAGTNTAPEYIESSQAMYFNNGDYHSGFLRPDAGGVQATGTFSFSTTSGLTIYAVTNCLSGLTTGYNSILRLSSVGAPDIFFSFQPTVAGLRDINFRSIQDNTFTYPTGTYLPYTTHVSALVLSSSTATLFVDGIQKATQGIGYTPLTSTIVQASIGAGYDNRVFTGYIHELVVYETSHTPTQRQAMEAYLTSKWRPSITLKTNFSLYQYIPIDPILVTADGRGPVKIMIPSLPNALTFNPLTGEITGQSVQAGSDSATAYAVDEIGTTTLDLNFTTILPFAVRRQPNASSYTSYVRQYAIVNGAQNARDQRVLTEDSHQGQFTAPTAPDVVTQTVDPKCFNPKTC
jgi:hypothetical protein